ncbi:unnamed protein product [Aphanomyces euteiches]|nr:hypothetical protein AeRB84_021427 [Aphanomyces euteiches]
MAEEPVTGAVQGRVTGLIYPPPEIRAVVDKTAQFVARNGRSFERKIAGEVISAKFSFLKPSDPYNAYYEHKVQEFENQANEPESAANTAAAPAKEPEAPPAPAEPEPAKIEVGVVEKKAVDGIVSKSVKSLKDKNEPPAEEQFKQKHPTLTPLDQEIMYLTAQYTAVSGKPFLSGLATREQRNPQFDFLKPTHPLFAYFTFLVESYAKILTAKAQEKKGSPLIEQLTAGMDRMQVLDRCVHKHEWIRREEEEKHREEMATDAEKLAYQQIDWHDFVVVEVITFDENDDAAPGQLPYLDESGQVQTAGTAATSTAPANVANDDDDDMDMDMEEEERPAEIKVVEDYVPRVAAPSAPAVQITSVDGQAVSSSEANEHMRILLQAPKYREEKARHLQKVKDSPFAPGAAIADNFKRFATKRTDIFTSSAEEEAKLVQATSTSAAQSAATSVPQDDDDDSINDAPSAYLPVQTQSRIQQFHIPPPPQSRPPPPPPMPPRAIPPPPTTAPPSIVHPPRVVMPPPPGMIPLAPGMVVPPPMMVVPPGAVMMEQPAPKRQRVDGVILMPEDEWAALRPGNVRLYVQVPYEPDNTQWKLSGQTLTIETDIKSLIRDVKQQIQDQTDMPISKQQIKAPVVGFLKDSLSCAHYNFEQETVMELSVRQRGGRR